MEQHLIIDWVNYFDDGFAIVDWQDMFTPDYSPLRIKQTIPVQAYLRVERLMRMRDFYNTHVNDFRGAKDFTVYIVTDENPTYDLRDTSKGWRSVNTKMFDLKQALRKVTGGGCRIHTTDNIQETKDNLRALGLFQHYDRREFRSLKNVFDALNKGGINYVVLRNYEKFPALIEEHPDVDLLTDDYYAVKRIIDGDNPFKPSFEDGGYRIHNYVSIGGRDIGFDIRYVGDNYYDAEFEKHILQNKVKCKNFWIPDEDGHELALQYHNMVHKGVGVDWRFLDVCMELTGFKYVEPNDKSVGYHRE